MKIANIYFEDLNKYPLLEKFWDEYLNKAIDYTFKERNLAFVDIHYHNGVPAFVVVDDNGNKLGIIVELELDGQPLCLSPNENEGDINNPNAYFIYGFNNMGLKTFKIVIKLYNEEYINRFRGQSNDRRYITNNLNYWTILTNDNDGHKLYVSFPNLVEI